MAFLDRNRGVHPQVGLTVNGNERVRHTIVGHKGCPRVQPADKAVLLDALVGAVATDFKCVHVKNATAVLNQIFIHGQFVAFSVVVDPKSIEGPTIKQRFNDVIALNVPNLRTTSLFQVGLHPAHLVEPIPVGTVQQQTPHRRDDIEVVEQEVDVQVGLAVEATLGLVMAGAVVAKGGPSAEAINK